MKSPLNTGILPVAALYVVTSLVPSATQAAFDTASSVPDIYNKKFRTLAATIPMPSLCNKSDLADMLSSASAITETMVLMRGMIENDPNYKDNHIFFQTLSSLTAHTLFSKEHADPKISALAYRVGCQDRDAKPRLISALLNNDVFKNYPAISVNRILLVAQQYLEKEQKLEAASEMAKIFSRHEQDLQKSLAVLMTEIADGNSNLSLKAFNNFNGQYERFLEEWSNGLQGIIQRWTVPTSLPSEPK